MAKAISENKLHQQHSRMEMRFSSKEKLFLADEIKNLLQKSVKKKSQDKEGKFVSPMFLVPCDFKPEKA